MSDSIPYLLGKLASLLWARFATAAEARYLENYRLVVWQHELWLCAVTDDWKSMIGASGRKATPCRSS